MLSLSMGVFGFSGRGSVNEDRMAFYTILGGFDLIIAMVFIGLVVNSYKTERWNFVQSKRSVLTYAQMIWLIAANEARRLGTVPSFLNRTTWIVASVLLLAATTWLIYLCLTQPIRPAEDLAAEG
ncbi:MAG TPA: hypothetical protein VK171_12290 [Fimbriimonas sp.]|nr:hypothetical protein [Fimbriimonas sp.]